MFHVDYGTCPGVDMKLTIAWEEENPSYSLAKQHRMCLKISCYLSRLALTQVPDISHYLLTCWEGPPESLSNLSHM